MSRTTPLDVIRIKEPCHESWDAMTGDAKTRFCAGCQRHVHNLSAMPREEADRLVCESAGRLCVRYEQGADGAPVTLGYQKQGRIRGGWKAWTAVGAIGACLAGAAQAMIRPKPVPVPAVAPPVLGQMLMGEIAVPTPVPPPLTTRPMLMGAICPVDSELSSVTARPPLTANEPAEVPARANSAAPAAD
jgi:hypothetical protein